MSKWEDRFMHMAHVIATYSKDTNMKVGTVIVNNDKIVLSTGYNGFPRGCDDSKVERYEKPLKYMYTEHAERNAIYHAARLGTSLKDSTLYGTYFPCCDCARAIIQSGIKKIIAPEPNLTHATWGKSFQAALEMFEEAGVEVKLL